MRVVQDVSGICPCLIISFLSALTTKRRWRSKTELLLFVSLCEDAWQTPFRQWFFGREDTCQASLSNITILEQSVYVASHQTENDVNSNGISSLCLVNRELARDAMSHKDQSFLFHFMITFSFSLAILPRYIMSFFVHLLLSRFYEHEHRSNILCPTTNYTAFKSEKLTTIR